MHSVSLDFRIILEKSLHGPQVPLQCDTDTVTDVCRGHAKLVHSLFL